MRYKSFDLIKSFACIAVVLIHFNFPGDFGIAVRAFSRFAVPVFFAVSGFFFLKDGKADDKRTLDKIRHILRLLLFAGLFFAIYHPIVSSLTINGWYLDVFVKNLFTAGKFTKFIILNEPFVYTHLWFMLALIYCYIFGLLFSKSSRLKYIKFLAPILLVLYTLMQEFGGILKFPNSVPLAGTDYTLMIYNTFLFRALPFFLFGILMSLHKSFFERLPLGRDA